MKKNLSQFELGYLSGIIEGEGCFEARQDDKSNSLDLLISVSSDSPQLLRWLKNKIGGKVYKDDKNTFFLWQVRKPEILDILKKIKPFLLFKRQQCDSMIRLMELLAKPQSGVPLTDKTLQERSTTYLEHRGLVNEPHEINRKGKNNDKVLIALSGGVDSTTLLYYLKWKGFIPEAISIDYGQKHKKKELESAKTICQDLKLKHEILDLSFMKNVASKSALISEQKIPEGHYDQENMKQTVVPNRNGIILSILAGAAISRNIPNIAFGGHASDSAIYPDCRPIFTYSQESVIQTGNWEQIALLAPFLPLQKRDIVFLGTLLKVPYEKTWSCYNGESRPCLKCGTDIERIESFVVNDLKDPLLTDKEWRQAQKNLKKFSK